MAPKPPHVRSSPAEPWRFSGVVDRAGVPQRVAMQISRHRTDKMFQRGRRQCISIRPCSQFKHCVSLLLHDLRRAAERITLYVDTLPTVRERWPMWAGLRGLWAEIRDRLQLIAIAADIVFLAALIFR